MENTESTKELESLDIAKMCVQTCEDTKEQDILLFDVRERQSMVAEYYIVCSGTSMPHIRAIADHVKKTLVEAGLRPRGADGDPESRWMVLDYGLVLVHILEPEMRNFYQLEELWDESKVIYRSTPVKPASNFSGR
ncbi:MAG: ribosome silencing factor [Lentisphaeria bacterium]|nr:ribosome silencing factor [Lentisphaeria bacterium]